MTTFVYVVGVAGSGVEWQEVCKIGFSRDPRARVKGMQTGSPVPIDLYDAFDCGSELVARRIEKVVHDWFKVVGIHGEWFEVDPAFACRVVFSFCKRPAVSGKEYATIGLSKQEYEEYELRKSIAERRAFYCAWHVDPKLAQPDEGYDDGRWFELLPDMEEA